VPYDRILIVGGGPAALSAAVELGRLGFSGELTAVCEETYPPYDRTACSKGLLTGLRRPSDVFLPISPDADIQWCMGRRAVGLDPVARAVFTDTGEVFAYDGLVIATGTRPTAVPGWPKGEPGLHTLHGLADAVALRRDLREAERVVVVGAGLTGCETAYAVRALHRECVLVDRNPQVLTRAIGERAGWLVTQELRRDGISLRLGRRFRSVMRQRGRWRIHLDNGDAIDADVVVATLGEQPDTAWLADSGLDLSNGVLCDEALCVVGTDGVVAAGAVARWPNPRYGGSPMRSGHWISALEQGRAAARSLLAVDHPAPPLALVPRFWSEQGELRIQGCGDRPADAEEEITLVRPGRFDTARAGVLISHAREGRLVGMVAINAPHAFAEGMRALLAA
jgi:NADPH-dependent 2,4-dienoyl-CoA reductase/sulfur reductase-like enzyme